MGGQEVAEIVYVREVAVVGNRKVAIAVDALDGLGVIVLLVIVLDCGIAQMHQRVEPVEVGEFALAEDLMRQAFAGMPQKMLSVARYAARIGARAGLERVGTDDGYLDGFANAFDGDDSAHAVGPSVRGTFLPRV